MSSFDPVLAQDGRRISELIFNQVAKANSSTDTYGKVTWDTWNKEGKPQTKILNAVSNILSGNFVYHGSFNDWWEARMLGDFADDILLQRLRDDEDYRIQVGYVFRELVAERNFRLTGEREYVVEYERDWDPPKGWAREPADLYIGPHGLNLPGPEAIGIHEDFALAGAGSIRTDGDPIWREPRARVDITIDKIYKDEDAITNEFRPLLAYLRAAPLTVLQSPLLNTTVLRHMQDEPVFAALAAAQKDWEANEHKVRQILKERGIDDEQTLNQLKESLTTDSEFARSIEELARNYTPPPNAGTIPGPLPRVPAMFAGCQVQSISDGTHTFRARFTFAFMNEFVISADGLRFLDGEGNETDSIWECAWLKRYVEMGWLDKNSDLYMPEYPVGGSRMKFAYNSEMAPFQADPVEEDHKDIIVEGIVCGFRNKLARIPIAGQDLPSCQYLGRENAKVELMLNCTLKGIERITRVKSSIEHNVHSNIKNAREDQLELILPIVNTMGFTDFVITRVQTQTEDQMTDRYRVLVTLVENSVKLRNRETLVLNNNQISKKAARSLWDYMWDIYTKYQDGLLEKERYPEYDYIRSLFFGNMEEPLEGCLINSDVLRAATWMNENLREYLGEFWNWTEGSGVGTGPGFSYGTFGRGDPIVFHQGKRIPSGNKPEAWNDTRTYRLVMDRYFSFRRATYRTGTSLIHKDDVDQLSPEQRKRLRKGLYNLVPFEFPDLLELPGQKIEDFKTEEDFYNSWRNMMATQDKEDRGPEKDLTRIAAYLRNGRVIVNKDMQDLLFEAIWQRKSPKAFAYLDRNHRLWAARREQYVEDVQAGRASNFLFQGSGLEENATREEIIAEYNRNHPARKVKDAPALWGRGYVNDSFRMLHFIALYTPDVFPLWKIDGEDPAEYIDRNIGLPVSRYDPSQTELDYRSLSCYPDFALPTYRQLFTFNGGLNSVWVYFAPTAAQLGLTEEQIAEEPRTVEGEPLGVRLDDVVDPTFFFATGKYKSLANNIKRELLSDQVILESIKGKSFVRVDVSLDNFNEKHPIEGSEIGALHTLVNDLRNESGDQEYYNKDAKEIFEQLASGDIDEVRLTTNEAVVIAVATRDPEDPTGKKFNITPVEGSNKKIRGIDDGPAYDLEDPKTVQRILRQSIDSIPEDKQDVKRCFPTFRLRFIDFDSGLHTDEFYDYNAVRAIHIFRDKYSSDTCELEIMNLTGVLDTDVFFTESELRETGMPTDDEDRSVEDEHAGRLLKSIKLREGVSIQILMGYDANPRNLESVFTGRISQIQMGEVVKIIAQGYKTELQNEVTFHSEGETWANNVRKIFQHLDGEGHVPLEDIEDEIERDERKNGTPHLGTRTDLASASQVQKYNELMRQLFADENLVYGSGADRWVGPFKGLYRVTGLGADLRDLTIDGRSYIDLSGAKPSRMRNIKLRNFIQSKKDFWIASYQPGFDALMEMASFMPGWVCDVVPYDHLATVYMGPPGGEYYWTSKFNRQIVQRARRPVQKTLSEKKQRIIELLEDFYWYGLNWKANHKGLPAVEWLPDDFRERNIETLMTELRGRSESLWRAFIGAFYGFDLITQNDFPGEVSDAIWRAVDIVISYDGPADANAIRVGRYGGEVSGVVLRTTETARRKIEYLVANTPGMSERLYRLSHFRDPQIQEWIGRICYLFSYAYREEDVEVESLEGATLSERLRSEVDLSQIEDSFKLAFETSKFALSPTEGTVRLGHTIKMYPPRNINEPIGYLVQNKTIQLKIYLYLMHKFLTDQENTNKVSQFMEDLTDVKTENRNPDRKPFRDIHLVTSRYDIIENNIVASMREMANSILLRYPNGEPVVVEVEPDEGPDVVYLDEADTEWAVFKHPDGIPFHPNIKLEQKKLAISVAKNATSEQQATLVFLNQMGNALRPMYRGNLVMWGKSMKPHDVVFIADDFNEMRGPVEVERCIHHFTPQTGWTTTIVPHAYVHVDNKIDIFQASILEKVFNAISFALDVVDWGLLIFTVITLGGGAVLSRGFSALKSAGKSVFKGALKKAGKNQLKRHIYTGSKAVFKPGSQKIGAKAAAKMLDEEAGQSLLLGGARGAREALRRQEMVQLGKEAGKMMRPWMTNGLRATGLWGVLGLSDAFVKGYSTHLATTGSKQLQGMVSLTPLMFEGRPLVAGLDYDDKYYLSMFDNVWKYLASKFDAAADFLAKEIPELFTGEEEVERPEFGVIAPHKGVK